MPKFDLSAFPCAKTPDGFISMVITDCLGRETVECAVSDLPQVLTDFAAKLGPAARLAAEHPQIYASADPAGRAPNGWKKVEAAKQNRVIVDRPAPQVAA